MAIEFGTLLATREFTWLDDEFEPHSAFADISTPQHKLPQEDGEFASWFCTVRLRAFGDETVRIVEGENTMQAIHLGMVMLGLLVAARPLAQHTDYAEVPNYGFPPPPQLAGNGGGDGGLQGDCGCGGS